MYERGKFRVYIEKRTGGGQQGPLVGRAGWCVMAWRWVLGEEGRYGRGKRPHSSGGSEGKGSGSIA